MGIPTNSGLHSIGALGRDDRECLRKTRLSKAMAEHQRLLDEQLFYKELSRVIPDEAQWDFIMWLAGYTVPMSCRFQLDPLTLENLRLLYKEITDGQF